MNEKCSRKKSQEHTHGQTNTFTPAGKTNCLFTWPSWRKRKKTKHVLHTKRPDPRIEAGGGTRSEYTDLEKRSSISTQVYTNLFLLWGEFIWKSTRISINCHSTWISVSAFYQLYCICCTVVLIWSTVVVNWCRYLPRHVRSKVRMPGSDEAGVLEELDENLVDKLVLGDGLHHQHPLLPQPWQHGRNLHWLRGREEETDGHWKNEK